MFKWAATYVITDAGQMVFKTWGKKVVHVETFGGGMPKPSNIVFAIAKLRRELADESSITLTDQNCVKMSPLIVLGDGLVQIAMIKQAWLDEQMLWVPEAARSYWFWEKKQKDDITGFWEVLYSDRGSDLRENLAGQSGSKVETKSINEVLQWVKGSSRYQWRDCDLNTLQKIMPIINVMMQNSLPSGVSFLDTTSWCTAEFKALMRCNELRSLWKVAMEPWPQILKYHSEMLMNFAYVRFALSRPTVPIERVLESHGACLQGGLAMLWRAQECREANELGLLRLSTLVNRATLQEIEILIFKKIKDLIDFSFFRVRIASEFFLIVCDASCFGQCPII